MNKKDVMKKVKESDSLFAMISKDKEFEFFAHNIAANDIATYLAFFIEKHVPKPFDYLIMIGEMVKALSKIKENK